MEIARASTEEKETQIRNLQAFWKAHEEESEAAIARLQEVAVNNGNIFAELMESVKVASLGKLQKLYMKLADSIVVICKQSCSKLLVFYLSIMLL